MTVDAGVMRDRYGIGKGWASQKVAVAFIAVSALTAVVVIVLLVAEAFAPGAAVDNTGHTVVSDSEVLLRFTVQSDEGATVICHASAVNDSFAEIGAADIRITLTEYREAHEAVLHTSERAAAGHIEYCDIAD